ncbi:MAG: 50S ribosomal protein L10 [Bacteroidota bacterium]
MTKAEKIQLTETLVEQFKEHPSFYILDIGNMPVMNSNAFRNKMRENGLQVQMVKNTLIKKALEQLEGDFTELDDVLKGSSALVFVGEKANAPAKALKDFRGDGDKPALKAASIEEAFFIGDEKLDELSKLKSKEDLIAEVISLLQSPAKNVISALQSPGGKLAGILQTLSEREAA